MGWIGETVDSIKSIQIRQLLTQAVSLDPVTSVTCLHLVKLAKKTAVLENSMLVFCFVPSARISGVLNLLLLATGMIVTSALIIWKALMCITGSESPVVVVLSGSMEPGFKRLWKLRLSSSSTLMSSQPNELVSWRLQKKSKHNTLDCLSNYIHFLQGDILFLHMSKDPIRAGEIVVFNIDGREIPIVHRVIKVHERLDTGEVDVLTKGDNNYGDDRLLYAPGQLWLQRHHIMGRAVGFLPYVGWVTIIMTEKPIIKYILIGALGLLVITSKD
ncbi:hypothetical protein SADUNF_Sadunf01G0146100 [Salix dunnii]|uniref:Signal peptidase complex catalytic subunit SEC11 n=1 Tax=Salix dunnii TaxID=1413687 RepID=A0A835TMV4_9ROSI|nr:hypothetical protein SADUNF_Sadunf01G0146100 [Salix dunnii]